jgi:hypothetical protein
MAFPESSTRTGIYHIHSDYSYDGTNSLGEIADWARARGIRFVLLTEHDLGFDPEKFEKYRAECSKFSGDVLLVPGMEYEVIHCGAIVHIGAVGVQVLLDRLVLDQGILALVDAIHSHGGLALLHHPNNIKHVLTREHVEAFDFIELWNTKFDCDFAPNLQFTRWLRGMGSRGPYMVSADIHEVGRFHKKNTAFIDMDFGSDNLDLAGIAHRLKNRHYRCRKDKWVLSPEGKSQVPNVLYRLLPAVCVGKKKLFRMARFFVPEKYQKAVYKYVNRSWIR